MGWKCTYCTSLDISLSTREAVPHTLCNLHTLTHTHNSIITIHTQPYTTMSIHGAERTRGLHHAVIGVAGTTHGHHGAKQAALQKISPICSMNITNITQQWEAAAWGQ